MAWIGWIDWMDWIDWIGWIGWMDWIYWSRCVDLWARIGLESLDWIDWIGWISWIGYLDRQEEFAGTPWRGPKGWDPWAGTGNGTIFF